MLLALFVLSRGAEDCGHRCWFGESLVCDSLAKLGNASSPGDSFRASGGHSFCCRFIGLTPRAHASADSACVARICCYCLLEHFMSISCILFAATALNFV